MYSFKTFVAEEMGHRRQLGACTALGFFVFFSLVVFSRMSLPDSQMPYVFHFQSLRAMATIVSYQIVHGVTHTHTHTHTQIHAHTNTCTSPALHQSQYMSLIPPVQRFFMLLTTFFFSFLKYKLKFKTYYSALTSKDFDIVT